MIAVAAAGSVGETIAPSANADDRDRPCRRDDEPDRRQGDHPRVVAQRAQVAEERRRVEQRRQEDEQDEIGVELDVGDPRHEPEQEAADHQRDRVRDLQPVRQRVQPGGRHEERGDDDLQVGHGRDPF
jgi:hypothetical protein